MGRGGDRFGGGPSLGRFGGADRLDVAQARRSGVYPRKGKGWGQSGEAVAQDLLHKWNWDQRWTSWRRGMALAFNELIGDSQAYQPVEVLRLPAFAPQQGFTAAPALLAGFASRTSSEGRWTVAVKPRGSEIAPVPVGPQAQFDAAATTDDGEAVPLLVVQLPGCWQPGALAAGSSLIGELIEDSALSATALAGPEDDGAALLLMCVAVYQDDGLLVFDASQCWRRVRRANGTWVLQRQVWDGRQGPPRFRVGRHLTQSTAISCNCPAHLGIEYGRLRGGQRLGSQALFPSRGPGGGSEQEVPLRDALDRLLRQQPERRRADPLEGAGRRFAPLEWRRWPDQGCKHVHAVRFALGCPIAEPDDVPAVLEDYQQALAQLLPGEELGAPLAAPRFVEQLARRGFNEAAFRELGSTITTGAVGDAWGVTVEPISLLPGQIDGTFPGNCAPRFSQQQLVAEPRAAELALRGDVWAGRLTSAYSYPYLNGGELLDQPFYLPSRQVVPLLP